jgi:hypothetical protein
MTNNYENLHILYRAWIVADAHFTAALTRVYGQRAPTARYQLQHPHEDVRIAKRDLIRAADNYRDELVRTRYIGE